MKNTVITIAAFSLVLAMTGCKEDKPQVGDDLDRLGRAAAPPQAQTAAGVPSAKLPPMGGSSSTQGSGRVHEGEVIERINVPNYTYVHIKKDGGEEVWAAIPSDKVEKGEKVVITESLVMKDFSSRSLGRTFDAIIFGTRQGAVPADGGAPADMGLPEGHPSIGGQKKMEGALPPGHPPIEGQAADSSGDQKPPTKS